MKLAQNFKKFEAYRLGMHEEQKQAQIEIGRLLAKASTLAGLDSREECEYFLLRRRLDNLESVTDIVDHVHDIFESDE